MGDFERETRVASLGEGRYRASLSSDWEIWGPNGGYLASIALRACGEMASIPRPVSFSCHFLRRGAFSEIEVRVEVLQRGRRSESLAFRVEQGERTLACGMLRTASAGPALEHDVSVAPELPGPDGLKSFDELQPEGQAPVFPFWNNFDRHPPDPSRVGRPPEKRPPLARDWLRFRPRATFEGEPFLDAARSVVLIDAECPLAENGLMATHARVWSARRELLASGGAQLLCVPPDASS